MSGYLIARQFDDDSIEPYDQREDGCIPTYTNVAQAQRERAAWGGDPDTWRIFELLEVVER